MMMATDMLLKYYAISNIFFVTAQPHACRFLTSMLKKERFQINNLALGQPLNQGCATFLYPRVKLALADLAPSLISG